MLYRFDDCELDDRLYQLRRQGELVEIEPKAFDLLVYLLHQREQVVAKDELLDKVWPGTVVSEAALTRCIARAREAVGDDGEQQRIIKTQHGRGYRFVAAVMLAPPVVSSQHSVASSQQEETQTTTGNDSLASRVQRLESEEQKPIVIGQTLDARLSDASRQTRDDSAPRRAWPNRGLLVVAVLLLAGTILTVHYLSRPTLSTQDSALSTQEAQLPLPDKPSIVVLPFVNMSKDPEQEYFSDGLTDVLTGNLSQISSLFVIARNSAFTYKGKAVKVQDVSKEMGVRYVLEGSLQKADQRVRITAQLIDATTGYHLWSEQYDRPLQDLFALQDEIVQKIVTTLQLQLALQEQGLLVRKATNNLEAYDYYLRGMQSGDRYTKEPNARARQMFERAVALDPRYAEAYAQLGWTYYVDWSFRWSQDPQALEQALALGQKALALDESVPAAHELVGTIYARKQQYDRAIAEGERVVALSPNNAESYAGQATVFNWAGRPADALQAITQAIRLNPLYPAWYLVQLGSAYQGTGQYAEAIAAYKQFLARNPDFLWGYPPLAGSYLAQWASQLNPEPQTVELALTAAQRAIVLNDAFAPGHMILGYVYLWQKQYEQALAEMERAVALDPHEANGSASLAVVLSCMGRTEDALEAAAQALRLKPTFVDNHLPGVGSAYALAGRPEEAIAPLKQFIVRYPNFLPVHLTLATVYSELGQEAEARAEAAEVLRLNPNFSLEIHKQRASIKDPVVLERHITALRKAGLK